MATICIYLPKNIVKRDVKMSYISLKIWWKIEFQFRGVVPFLKLSTCFFQEIKEKPHVVRLIFCKIMSQTWREKKCL